MYEKAIEILKSSPSPEDARALAPAIELLESMDKGGLTSPYGTAMNQLHVALTRYATACQARAYALVSHPLKSMSSEEGEAPILRRFAELAEQNIERGMEPPDNAIFVLHPDDQAEAGVEHLQQLVAMRSEFDKVVDGNFLATDTRPEAEEGEPEAASKAD